MNQEKDNKVGKADRPDKNDKAEARHTGPAVRIDRVFLRRKPVPGTGTEVASDEPERQMVVVSVEDDLTIILADHSMKDQALVESLFAVEGNATLEEICYFCEMGQWPIVVDGRFYPFRQVRRVVEDGNRGWRRSQAHREDEAEDNDANVNVSVAATVEEKQAVGTGQPGEAASTGA